MAGSGKSSGSEWTAGVIAIIAALLIGSAIPIGLYFGLYMPKYRDRMAAEEKKTELATSMTMMIARQERITNLEKDADTVAERIEQIEKPFAVPVIEDEDVPDARIALLQLASDHKLARLPERQILDEIVTSGRYRIPFPNGLMATKLKIEALAYYHDFGRFVTAMETLERFVIIPESLICTGDSNQSNRHKFRMVVYVIERRDVDSIGR